MSTVVSKNYQIGADGTASNNFTLYQPATPDGTLRLGNGNTGITSSLLTLTSAGNLGIGTSSPSQALHVVSSQTQALFEGSNQGNIIIRKTGTNGMALYSNAAGTLQIYDNTAAATRLTLDSSGNLGLGVTPSAWSDGGNLEMFGCSVSANNGAAAYGINIVNNAYYNSGWKYKDTFTAGLYQIDNATHRWYTAPSGTAGNAISFTQAMTLNASGNLGIGTTSPTTRLSITDSAGPVVRLVRTSNRFEVAADNDYMELNARDASTYIRFKTADTERARIDSSGNMGIGTTSPITTNARLSVKASGDYDAGLAIGSNASAANWARLDFKNTNAANPAILYQDASGTFNIRTDGAYAITFNTNGGNERARIDSSGNFGIGTSSPAYRLHVVGGYSVIGTHNTTALPASNSGGGAAFSWNKSNGSAETNICNLYDNATLSFEFSQKTGASTANTLLRLYSDLTQFYTNNTERARIDSSGNLLVGTTSLTPIGSGYNSFNVAGTNGAGAVFKNSAGSQFSYVWCDALNRLYCVQNTGGVYLTSGATSWTANSDERQKDIIESITDAANKVATLRAVIGKYKTDDEGVRRAFLIAQDVQAVLPEAVDASDPEKLGVQYTDTIPLLVAAIQEQQAIINQLKADVAALKSTHP